MPTYEYKCAQCGRFEKVQPITADPLPQCPTCGGQVERLISRNVNIIFKGSGFHITDYRSPGDKGDTDASGNDANGSKGSEATDGSKSTNGSADASKRDSNGATQPKSSKGSTDSGASSTPKA